MVTTSHFVLVISFVKTVRWRWKDNLLSARRFLTSFQTESRVSPLWQWGSLHCWLLCPFSLKTLDTACSLLHNQTLEQSCFLQLKIQGLPCHEQQSYFWRHPCFGFAQLLDEQFKLRLELQWMNKAFFLLLQAPVELTDSASLLIVQAHLSELTDSASSLLKCLFEGLRMASTPEHLIRATVLRPVERRHPPRSEILGQILGHMSRNAVRTSREERKGKERNREGRLWIQ